MTAATLREHLARLDAARSRTLGDMTARAQLQWAYELAFHPARLNAAWNDWERRQVSDLPGLRAALGWALALHQRLPEAPAVAARALRRLASYQATARLYRLPTMLCRFREKLGATDIVPVEVPAWMVRDIALPVFGRGALEASAPAKQP